MMCPSLRTAAAPPRVGSQDDGERRAVKRRVKFTAWRTWVQSQLSDNALSACRVCGGSRCRPSVEELGNRNSCGLLELPYDAIPLSEPRGTSASIPTARACSH